jgi:Gpi18-like mannosyltransferase
LVFKLPVFTSFGNFLSTYSLRWDGVSYSFLALHGYATTGIEKVYIVFPPFYPLILAATNLIFRDIGLTGFFISNIFFVWGLLILYKLLRLDYPKSFSFWVIVLYSLFPTTFFFSVTLPESLFIFLIVSCLYLIRKGKFWPSALLAGLATLTKPFGILIWPALLIEWYISAKRNLNNISPIILGGIIFPTLYLILNTYLFGKPLAFIDFIGQNWQKHFTPFWTSIISSWQRGITTTKLDNYKFLTGYGEAIFSTLAWIFSLIAIFLKPKIRISYIVYLFLGTLMFTSTGFILSAPRYLLSLFPFFIVLNIVLAKPWLKIIFLMLSVGALFYLSYFFALGQWTF